MRIVSYRQALVFSIAPIISLLIVLYFIMNSMTISFFPLISPIFRFFAARRV